MYMVTREGEEGETRYIKTVAEELQSGDKVKAVRRDKGNLPLANRQWREAVGHGRMAYLLRLTTKRVPSLL